MRLFDSWRAEKFGPDLRKEKVSACDQLRTAMQYSYSCIAPQCSNSPLAFGTFHVTLGAGQSSAVQDSILKIILMNKSTSKTANNHAASPHSWKEIVLKYQNPAPWRAIWQI